MQRQIEVLELKTEDGRTLRGVFCSIPDVKGEPAVVFAHGFGSTRSGEKALAVEEECTRRGWSFASFDFHGHGASDGAISDLRGSRLLEDLDLITSEIAQRTGGPLFLFGSSMGGWAAAWFAARNPGRIAGCALVAPAFRFLEFQRLSSKERLELRRTGRLRVQNQYLDVQIGYGLVAEAPEYPVETLLKEYHTPTVIFHGMADDVVPFDLSVEFAEKCPSTDLELLLLKSGDHRLNREKERLARLACDFYEKHLA
jgi:uncharacterized protein